MTAVSSRLIDSRRDKQRSNVTGAEKSSTTWLVKMADITQLEMQAGDIAAEMYRRVAEGTQQSAIAV